MVASSSTPVTRRDRVEVPPRVDARPRAGLPERLCKTAVLDYAGSIVKRLGFRQELIKVFVVSQVHFANDCLPIGKRANDSSQAPELKVRAFKEFQTARAA
jgi:hypothetical protein